MPQFKDLKSLFRYVEKNMTNSLNYVAREIEKVLKEYIIQNLYQAYTPEDYARTYDYINSITVSRVNKVGNEHQVEIYFDTNKIRQELVEDRYWNQHMSVDGSNQWNGMSINELIPIFMEYGVEGSKYDREGIYAIENTVKLAEQTEIHIKEIKRILKSRGIPIE